MEVEDWRTPLPLLCSTSFSVVWTEVCSSILAWGSIPPTINLLIYTYRWRSEDSGVLYFMALAVGVVSFNVTDVQKEVLVP